MKRLRVWLLIAALAVPLSLAGLAPAELFTVPAEASLWDFFKSKTAKAVELRTAEDLEELRKNPEGSFVLAEDISLDYVPFSAIESFNGTLDGQGHWIDGLAPEMGSDTVTCLFDTLGSEAVVKDLNVRIGILMDSDVPVHISGLAGSNNGTVRGCRIQSEIVWNDEVCTEPEPAIALQHYAPVAAYNGGTIADCTLQTGVNALGNVYGIVEENYGTVTNCDVDLNTNSCTNVSGLAYRNWEAIDGCWVSGQADTVTEFCCIARQNYAPITNCRFDMWINGPAGQGCSWSLSGFEGDGHSFDDSNTVNISELNNRAGNGAVGSGTVGGTGGNP